MVPIRMIRECKELLIKDIKMYLVIEILLFKEWQLWVKSKKNLVLAPRKFEVGT
jgi:hypothetical protein